MGDFLGLIDWPCLAWSAAAGFLVAAGAVLREAWRLRKGGR